MILRRAACLAGALVVLGVAPAAGQAAVLNPLKPCYVSVTQRTSGAPKVVTEQIDLGGSGFTPGALVDVILDGKLDRTLQADTAGNLPPQLLQSPYQRRGQGTFALTTAERGNALNTVTLPSRRVALKLDLTPKDAKPNKRIRFKGAGFTEQKGVWAHYLYEGKLRKTVRLVRKIANPCGTFSVRRKQLPIKRPRRFLGRWRLQVDQQRKYSRAPAGVNVRADIDVQQVF